MPTCACSPGPICTALSTALTDMSRLACTGLLVLSGQISPLVGTLKTIDVNDITGSVKNWDLLGQSAGH